MWSSHIGRLSGLMKRRLWGSKESNGMVLEDCKGVLYFLLSILDATSCNSWDFAGILLPVGGLRMWTRLWCWPTAACLWSENLLIPQQILFWLSINVNSRFDCNAARANWQAAWSEAGNWTLHWVELGKNRVQNSKKLLIMLFKGYRPCRRPLMRKQSRGGLRHG